MAKRKLKLNKKSASIILTIVSALVVYQLLSPSGLYFGLDLKGGDPRDNAYEFVVKDISEKRKSCTVIFKSSFGDSEPYEFSPCRFQFKSAIPTPRLTGFFDSRGGKMIGALDFYNIWNGERTSSSNWVSHWVVGKGFRDDKSDDFSWNFRAIKDGKVESRPVNGGCIAVNLRSHRSQCVTEYGSKRRCSTPNGGEVDCYYSGSGGTTIVDSSNTFKITAWGSGSASCYSGCDLPEYNGKYSIEFEIIDDNFYAREALAKRTIPSNFHYRNEGNCPALKNYTLVSESFSAGRSVNKDSLRWVPIYVCADAPVLIIDGATDETVSRSTDILKQLVDGETLTVPNGEVWRIDYGIKANKQLGLYCDPTNVTLNQDGTCPVPGGIIVNSTHCEVVPVLDADNGGCTTTHGLWIACGEGAHYEASLGCVIQPVKRCPTGTVEEVKLDGSKTCIKFLPAQKKCENEDELYDVDEGKCYYIEEEQGNCAIENATYTEDIDKCRRVRPLDPVCDESEGEVLEEL
jgi:hypothetical protein